MSRNLILIFFLGISFTIVYAQDSTLSTRPAHYLFTKNHLSITLSNGLTRGKTSPLYGPEQPLRSIGAIHSLEVSYECIFNKTWAASASLGAGFFPYYFRIPYESWYLFRYWDYLEGAPFLHFSADATFRFSFARKHFMSVFAGPDLFKFSELEASIGMTDYGSGTTPKFRQDITYYSNAAWLPGFHFGIGRSRILKNYDLFTIKIIYHYSFKDFVGGQYFIDNFTTSAFSAGKVLNKGKYLALGLTYEFTKAQKQARLSKITNKTGERNPGKVKRIYRRQQRKPMMPYSTTISVHGSFTLQPCKVSDVNAINVSTLAVFIAPEIRIQQFIKSTNFVEAGFKYMPYASGVRNSKMFAYCAVCGEFTNAFDALQLSLGVGKRITNKKNFNFIDVHAGIDLSYVFEDKGLNGSGGSSFFRLNDTLYQETSKDYQKRKWFPMVYFGLSKDLKIRGKLYFTASYFYHQGILEVFKSEAEYTSVWTTGKQYYSIVVNGSNHALMFGFKYNLGNVFSIEKVE